MENFTLEGPIGYYNGLIIAALLLVILWSLMKLDERIAKKDLDKMMKEVEKIKID